MDFFAGPLCDFNWVIKSSSTDCFGLVAVQLWYFFPPDPDDQYLIKDGVSKNRGSECAPQRNGPKPKLIEFPTRKRPDKSSDLSRAHFFITCYGGPACGHRYLNCLFGKWFFFFSVFFFGLLVSSEPATVAAFNKFTCAGETEKIGSFVGEITPTISQLVRAFLDLVIKF